MSAEDPSVLSQLVNYLAGAAIALAGLVWTDNKRRVARVEMQLDIKANKDELERQRDNVATLFDEQNSIRREMAQGFSDLTEQVHRMHVELLERIK